MKKSELSGWEFLAILVVWIGVISTTYLLKDIIFGIIAVAVGSYICQKKGLAMDKIDCKAGKLYKIVDVGKNSIYHWTKDAYIGKIVRFRAFHSEKEEGFIRCDVIFPDSFTFEKNGRKIHIKKEACLSFYEVKLEKVKI